MRIAAWSKRSWLPYCALLALWALPVAAAPDAHKDTALPLKTLRYAPPGWSAAKQQRVAQRLVADPQLVQRRLAREQEVLAQLGPHGVSQKAKWRRQRRQELIASGKRGATAPDTLNVLLVRIAFASDRSGPLTSITEDGNFLLRAPVDSVDLFDPPPHNKAYFQAHMTGLAEYWASQSAGRLFVNARVLPEGDEDAYFLSDIADYGPGRGGFWDIEGLVALVRDMILAADAGTQGDGSVNLADFDFDDPNTYIVFAHAGADIQSNLVFEPGSADYSPNDIPTFFVQLGDEDDVPLTSIDPDSGEPGRVTECSVIPETTSQDGLIGSIAAALYHEFGHALGLPDIYSTQTGLPSLGWWELMDSGTNLAAGIVIDSEFVPTDCDDAPPVVTVFGLLPPSTNAWSKWYLGYAEAVTVGGNGRDVTLHPSYHPDERDQILRIDAGGDEFFLVEHRWIPPTIPEGEVWSLIADPATGVVQYLGRVLNPGTILETVENTHLYDFFLPWPGGVFVYRIRQDRIDATIDYNAVQLTPELAGITLVEADGIPDIGRFDFRTIGFWGSETDAFRSGEQFTFPGGTIGGEVCDDFVITWPTTATELDATSRPSSESSFGLATGAWLRGVGRSEDAPMQLSAGVEGLLSFATDDAGFPVELPLTTGALGDVPLRADAASLSVFEFTAGTGIVFAAAAADASSAPSLFAYGLDGEPRFGAARMAELTASLSGPPVAAAAFTGGADALLVATRDGLLHAYTTAGSGQELGSFPVSFGDSVDVGPLPIEVGTSRYVFCGRLGRDFLRAIDEQGVAHAEYDYGLTPAQALRSAPIAADIDGDGAVDELVFVRGAELMATEIDGSALPGFPVNATALAAAKAIELLAWPRQDGPDDIACVAAVDSTGAVFRATSEGIAWAISSCGPALLSPPRAGIACADLDGDGEREIILQDQHRVHVRNRSGVALRGWPRRIDEEYYVYEFVEEGPSGAPLIADIDADGRRELIVTSQLGLIHAFDALGNEESGYPRRASGPVQAPLILDFDRGTTQGRGLLLLEARGDSLIAGGRMLSARLTALDLGDAPANAQGEWTALAGSMARQGRSGSAAASGQTLAAEESVSVAPNPARDHARIRFYAGAAHVARLQVFNLEGETVREAEESVTGGGAREIAFDLDGLVPGPYLCRLRYRGAGGRESQEVRTLYIE